MKACPLLVSRLPCLLPLYMSTTLTVLRVLMSADHDTLGHDRLMSQAAASALMTSSSTSSMVASLDPVLVDFWSGFPCPPPWNEGLLFRSVAALTTARTKKRQLRGSALYECYMLLVKMNTRFG